MIAPGQQYLFGDFSLCFQDRCAQIPATHREFDWDVALLLLAVNERRAGNEMHVRHVGQRYLHRPAVRVRRTDLDVANRLQVLAIRRREAHDDRKIAIAACLVKAAGCLTSDRRLNRGVDVTRQQAITRSPNSVDVDADRRLTQRGQHREIGDAWHRCHDVLDLVGGSFKHFEIAAVQLHRVLALDAGGGFFDVVLDILGEVEIDARETGLQSGGFTQVVSGKSSFYVPITTTAQSFGAWPAKLNRIKGHLEVQVPEKPLKYQAPLPESLYGDLSRPVRMFILGRDFNQDLGLWPRPAVLGPLLAERLGSVKGLEIVDGSGDTYFAYRANNALKSGQDFYLKEMGRARGAQWVLAGNCVAETVVATKDPDGKGRRVQGLTELRLIETEGDDSGLELVSESATTLVARAGRPLELAAREAMEASSTLAASYLAYHLQNLLAGRSHADKLVKLQFEGADKNAWNNIRGALGAMDSVLRLFRRRFSGGVLKVDVILRKEESEFMAQWASAPWVGGPPESLGTDASGAMRYRLGR